jgi:hypothetical protein
MEEDFNDCFLIEHLPIERRPTKVKDNKKSTRLQELNWKANTFLMLGQLFHYALDLKKYVLFKL